MPAAASFSFLFDAAPRWTDLVASASDVILTWDRKGRLTSLNTTGQHMLGLSQDDAVKHTLKDIVASECAAVVDGLMQQSPEEPGGHRRQADGDEDGECRPDTADAPVGAHRNTERDAARDERGNHRAGDVGAYGEEGV